MSQRLKYQAATVIASAFIFLFSYTGIDKIIHFNEFVFGISRLPLLSSFASFAGIGVIMLELAAVMLLFYPPARLYGFYLTAALTAVFTIYIGGLLLLSSKLPCGCGGLLKQLSWPSHLLLNIFLTALAVWGLVIEKKLRKQTYLMR